MGRLNVIISFDNAFYFNRNASNRNYLKRVMQNSLNFMQCFLYVDIHTFTVIRDMNVMNYVRIISLIFDLNIALYICDSDERII